MFLVTGGVGTAADQSPLPLDSTEIYDPDVGSWRARTPLPIPMNGLKAVTIANMVLIFGIIYHLFANIKFYR